MRGMFGSHALTPTVAQVRLVVIMLLFLLSALPIGAMSAAAGADSAGPDNTLFTHVLLDYVKDGAVNYKSLKADKRFAGYITLLMKTNPNTISRQNRLAFWINVYNAFVLNNEIMISKIFDWFGEDFKKYAAGVPAFISRYLPPEQGRQLLANVKTVKIKYHEYNWDLNE